MKKIILFLAPVILVPLQGFSQDKDTNVIKTTYKFDMTGVVNSVNGATKTVVNSSALNTVKWRKFESSLGTDYQQIGRAHV